MKNIPIFLCFLIKPQILEKNLVIKDPVFFGARLVDLLSFSFFLYNYQHYRYFMFLLCMKFDKSFEVSEVAYFSIFYNNLLINN